VDDSDKNYKSEAHNVDIHMDEEDEKDIAER